MVVSFEMKNTSAVRFQVLDMTGRNVMEGDWGELAEITLNAFPLLICRMAFTSCR